MKIIRHTARDMRQALRAVREQLGEDAVILSSKRTSEGVEVTAAVDFDAATLEAGGFANTPPTGAAAGIQAPAVAPVAVSPPTSAPAPSRTHAHVRVAPSSAKPAPHREDSLVASLPASARPAPLEDDDWISKAAREAVVAHVQALAVQSSAAAGPESLPPTQGSTEAMAQAVALAPTLAAAPAQSRTDLPVYRTDEVIERARSSSLTPFGPQETSPSSCEPATAAMTGAQDVPARAESPFSAPTAEAMGNELKSLRRMLETQLAHLAWNDLTRRAPIRTEILRELTEIGITHDLSEHLVRQLPEDTDLTFARRFTIAGLSQYLRVTGDRWLDEGGRVAFAGATGVGKTTTLAKVAVRWVLRHGPRDLALVAADPVRIGAQDQLRSLAQLLGVAVYSPDQFENLPSLL